MQTGGHDQIDVTAEDLLEPVAEAEVPEEAGYLFELHEEIHIALWPGVASCNGPEQVERAHSERTQFLDVRG